jgi:hypothetical protein
MSLVAPNRTYFAEELVKGKARQEKIMKKSLAVRRCLCHVRSTAPEGNCASYCIAEELSCFWW